MSNSVVMRLLNLGLRGSTLAAKFLLIFMLAYYLEPRDVALYGLLAASVSFGVYCIGLDFYTFSNREMIGAPSSTWARMLRDQGVLCLLLYVFVLPSMLIVFYVGFIPWALAPWFFAILVMEHLGQELNRLLVAMSRQLLASVVLFLRAGAWAFIVTFMFWSSESLRSLDTLLLLWVMGGVASLALGSVALRALERQELRESIDWRWIVKGLKVALPLLIATLALRGVFTVDRYWLQAVSGVEVLAAYVLFIGIGNALVSFLDASVFVFLYPMIVEAYKNKDKTSFLSKMKSLLLQTMSVACVFSLVAILLINPLLGFLNKDVYTQYVGMFYVILVSIFLLVISMVPHYGLYAMRKDRAIIASHVAAFLVFIVSTWCWLATYPVYGVPLSLTLSFAIMLVLKSLAYFLADKTSLR